VAGLNEAELQRALDRKFQGDSDGDPRRVVDLGIMPDGHAGLTYGFATVSDNPDDRRDYVIKIAPPGVRRSGNTDVFRLVPLTRVLRAAGRPVPDIPFAAEDERELGSPYIIMERLPGRTFIIWEPHESFSDADAAPVWRQAVAELAHIHGVDWQPSLSDWQKPRTLGNVIDFWTPLMAKAENPDWRTKGALLAEKLARRGPTDPGPTGIFHGDYQPGNILYDQGRMTGVIDWELSGIGPQGLDVGWLLMMMDPACWHPDWMPVCGLSRDEIIDVYGHTAGRAAPDPDWYQALACFVFGAITGLNVYLHRSGKRHDPIWDNFALCGESLLDRGLELCG